MRIFARALLLLLTPVSYLGAQGDQLVGFQHSNLYAIDVVTGATSSLGTVTGILGSGASAAILGACSSESAEFVHVSSAAVLYRVSVPTLQATVIGLFPPSVVVRELAFDPLANLLYATDYGFLYLVDTSNAALTPIGSHGPNVQAMFALAWVPGLGLRGFSGDGYYAVDPLTGTASLVASGLPTMVDVAYASGQLIGATTDEIYHVDPLTGFSTLLQQPVPMSLFGLARVPGPDFRRGDVDGSGVANLADAVVLLAALFVSGAPPLTCLDSGDLSDDGNIDLGDALLLLNYLFVPAATVPPPPGPQSCGTDPTSDALPACSSPSC